MYQDWKPTHQEIKKEFERNKELGIKENCWIGSMYNK